MPAYKVTDADGNVNHILADLAFVEQHYPGAYEVLPEPEPVPDPIPTPEQINAPILAKLDEIDSKSIRALREGDTARIAALEAQAAALRAQLVK